MGREVWLIFFGTLLTLKTFQWVGKGPLKIIAAILLLYIPFFHHRKRHLPFSFFEKELPQLIHSLKTFLILSLVIFPPFFLANHFYQTVLLEKQWIGISLAGSGSFLLLQIVQTALPEEFFFRGWFYPLLRQKWPFLTALIINSLLFAFMHSLFRLQWWHFSIFFPGLLFGWLREKTGAITAPILFHALSNLVGHWIWLSYQ